MHSTILTTFGVGWGLQNPKTPYSYGLAPPHYD